MGNGANLIVSGSQMNLISPGFSNLIMLPQVHLWTCLFVNIHLEDTANSINVDQRSQWCGAKILKICDFQCHRERGLTAGLAAFQWGRMAESECARANDSKLQDRAMHATRLDS